VAVVERATVEWAKPVIERVGIDGFEGFEGVWPPRFDLVAVAVVGAVVAGRTTVAN